MQDFNEKEADLVYRVKLKDQEVIFYLLLEMQSTVDFQMPYRLYQYMGEIWRDVLKNTDPATAGRKDYRLPAIVPIILYNGARRVAQQVWRWKSKQNASAFEWLNCLA